MKAQSSESGKNQAEESVEPENIRTSVREQAKKLNRLNTESELRNLGEINIQKTVNKESMESNRSSANNESVKVCKLFAFYFSY